MYTNIPTYNATPPPVLMLKFWLKKCALYMVIYGTCACFGKTFQENSPHRMFPQAICIWLFYSVSLSISLFCCVAEGLESTASFHQRAHGHHADPPHTGRRHDPQNRKSHTGRSGVVVLSDPTPSPHTGPVWQC